ncbi:MAG: hypothetical protein KME07_24380 [Pegethrix bostrychoides GSE-TBD4-15B]|jgi:hypothetical protein|uniref:Uncharacterized protein n=1 Tax=Pegethrix bostrychoides GSE-TBD4-15B TaxID=2839662 RepID=A0A951PFB3_9CYAN|nr:hypothetical protein [Pegethrix bostrychoides GSE-TBD4-15B]
MNAFNGSSNGAASPAWLKQSVQQFLQGVNWDNQPLEIQNLRRAAARPNQQLSLLLPVNQFFSAFSWDSAAQPMAAPSLPDADASTDAFTLDDFSGLFN